MFRQSHFYHLDDGPWIIFRLKLLLDYLYWWIIGKPVTIRWILVTRPTCQLAPISSLYVCPSLHITTYSKNPNNQINTIFLVISRQIYRCLDKVVFLCWTDVFLVIFETMDLISFKLNLQAYLNLFSLNHIVTHILPKTGNF